MTDNSTSARTEPEEQDNYVSSIGILPSSMPGYHRAYLAGRPSTTGESPSNEVHSEDLPRQQSSEEQAATARRLKPHSRSQLNLEKAAQKPENMTPLPAKKPKQTKWQFGIRSRNQPLEAMACIYRALHKLGAEWELEEPRDAKVESQGYGSESDGSGDEGDESEPREQKSRRRRDKISRSPDTSPNRPDSNLSSIGSDLSERRRERYESLSHSSHGNSFLPEDPWIISCRWLKGGMYPPGAHHPGSTHSSTVNLAAADSARKRSSTVGSVSSAAGSATSPSGSATHANPGSIPGGLTKVSEPNDSVYVYMEIQLYQVEKELHLVDFKCAGYERLFQVELDEDEVTGDSVPVPNDGGSPGVLDIRSAKGNATALHHVGKLDQRYRAGLRSAGRQTEEKDVSSPFPFLDLASKLIIALAEAN